MDFIIGFITGIITLVAVALVVYRRVMDRFTGG